MKSRTSFWNTLYNKRFSFQENLSNNSNNTLNFFFCKIFKYLFFDGFNTICFIYFFKFYFMFSRKRMYICRNQKIIIQKFALSILKSSSLLQVGNFSNIWQNLEPTRLINFLKGNCSFITIKIKWTKYTNLPS